MIFLRPVEDFLSYFEQLKAELNVIAEPEDPKLTSKAFSWISLVVTAIIMSGSVCWRRMERSSGGLLRSKAMSWMLHRGKRIPWEKLLIASVRVIIKNFDIKKCHLVCDDTSRHRSKNTKAIYAVHKNKDKGTGGYVMAQNIVFLALVSPSVSLIVGFRFYRPDPSIKKWNAEDKKLRKRGVKRKNRPAKPEANEDYPTRLVIFEKLVEDFRKNFSELEVTAICADAAFCSKATSKRLNEIYPKVQFISQLRSNQKIILLGTYEMRLDEYFDGVKEYKTGVKIRGGGYKSLYLAWRHVYVKAHGKEMKVVAMKYELEDDWRFVICTDPTWLPNSIIECYTYRWLIEVAIEDWKQYDGWGSKASQQGVDGARRGLCLSLLVDHALLCHPIQKGLHRTGKPLVTAGSLRDHVRFETLKRSFEEVIRSENPKDKLKKLFDGVQEVVRLRQSSKHMSGRDSFEPEYMAA